MLISYGQHDPLQFFFAFGFLPDMDITEMLVPLKSTEPLLLRANRQDLYCVPTLPVWNPNNFKVRIVINLIPSAHQDVEIILSSSQTPQQQDLECLLTAMGNRSRAEQITALQRLFGCPEIFIRAASNVDNNTHWTKKIY